MQIRMKCPVVGCRGALHLRADDDRGYNLPIVITCGECGTAFSLAGGNLRIVSERRPAPADDDDHERHPYDRAGSVVARALP